MILAFLQLQKKEVKRMGKRNDDRSNSMNPNNPAYQASMDNRSDQLNPNHPEYKDDHDSELENT
jgi:hypothetical protein